MGSRARPNSKAQRNVRWNMQTSPVSTLSTTLNYKLTVGDCSARARGEAENFNVVTDKKRQTRWRQGQEQPQRQTQKSMGVLTLVPQPIETRPSSRCQRIAFPNENCLLVRKNSVERKNSATTYGVHITGRRIQAAFLSQPSKRVISHWTTKKSRGKQKHTRLCDPRAAHPVLSC